MLHQLENKHWQVGILPQTGGSIAYARMRHSGTWVDVLRPTNEADYTNPSKSASFLMLPWANRIRDGLLRFEGESWQLQVTKDDGTARHGDVRKRHWMVEDLSNKLIRLHLHSRDFLDFNFPFRLSAELTYRLEDADFIWELAVKNETDRSYPIGFGFHPYFMPHGETLLELPFSQQYPLVNAMPESAPLPIQTKLDFREARILDASEKFDDLLTGRIGDAPSKLIYKDWRKAIEIHADALYQHLILFSADDGTIAIEPQSNANDGFNLRENGLSDGGVIVLGAKETASAAIRLRISTY